MKLSRRGRALVASAVLLVAVPVLRAGAAPGTSDSAAEQRADLRAAEAMPGYASVKSLSVPDLSEKRLASGKALAEVNCVMCHGRTLAGDGDAATALDPRPANLRRPDTYKHGRRELAIFRTIKYGVPNTGMVAWADTLSDAEIWNLVGYVRSVHTKATTPRH